jgi:hypothetical protein
MIILPEMDEMMYKTGNARVLKFAGGQAYGSSSDHRGQR